MLALQLAGGAVIDVVADILLMRENLMNGATRPLAAQIRLQASTVQVGRDFALNPAIVHEYLENPPHDRLLILRARHQHHPVSNQALLLAQVEHLFPLALLINQHAP